MTREFIMTSAFDRLWDKLDLNDDNLKTFQSLLLENPFIGDIIKGTGGARKTRPKNKQDELTHEQREHVKSFVKSLKGVQHG